MKKNFFILLVLLAAMVVLSGCAKKEIVYEGMAEHKDLIEETEYGNIRMSFSRLNGSDIRTFESKPDKVYAFKYTYLITEGFISLQFRDSMDNVLEEILLSSEDYETEKNKLPGGQEGRANIQEFGSQRSVKSTDKAIKIVINGNEAKGHFNITW